MSLQPDLLLYCDRSGIIRQVISERGIPDMVLPVNTGFSALLSPESVDAGLQFLKDIHTFGKAENRRFTLLINLKPVTMAFSGVLLADQLFISGNLLSVSKETASGIPETASFSAENQPYSDVQAEVGQMEMFEELSRLNNELINAKRELVRKNIELERLYAALKAK